MEVILLERISRLGQMGDTVKVKDGFARNFLLPKGKALRANEANKKKFEGQRAQLEARNLERKAEAQKVADKLDGKSFIVVRSAGETGQLYGSVSTRDIADLLTAEGFTSPATQVELNQPIKAIGLTNMAIALHPEVEVTDHAQHRPLGRGGRAPGQGRDADDRRGDLRRGHQRERPAGKTSSIRTTRKAAKKPERLAQLTLSRGLSESNKALVYQSSGRQRPGLFCARWNFSNRNQFVAE